jgi:hypothetical protein
VPFSGGLGLKKKQKKNKKNSIFSRNRPTSSHRSSVRGRHRSQLRRSRENITQMWPESDVTAPAASSDGDPEHTTAATQPVPAPAASLFPAVRPLPGGGHRELLREGPGPDRPPLHPGSAAVCTVRWLRRRLATPAAGAPFDRPAAEDLAALAAAGATETVRLEGNGGVPAWPALVGGMALGEAARFRPPAEPPSADTAPEVIVAELLEWIEERTLRGPATLYMERRAGVNDTGARRLRMRKLQIQARRLHGPGPHREEADRAACDGSPPAPLATVQVWCRATQGEDVMETGSEGAKFVIDEPGLHSGSPGVATSSSALPPFCRVQKLATRGDAVTATALMAGWGKSAGRSRSGRRCCQHRCFGRWMARCASCALGSAQSWWRAAGSYRCTCWRLAAGRDAIFLQAALLCMGFHTYNGSSSMGALDHI